MRWSSWTLSQVRPAPVERVGVDAREQLQPGEELRRPAARRRDEIPADAADHLAASLQGQRDVATSSRSPQWRARSSTASIGTPSGKCGTITGRPSRSSPTYQGKARARSVSNRSVPPRGEVPVLERERAPVLREESDAAPAGAEVGAERRDRDLNRRVHLRGRHVEEPRRPCPKAASRSEGTPRASVARRRRAAFRSNSTPWSEVLRCQIAGTSASMLAHVGRSSHDPMSRLLCQVQSALEDAMRLPSQCCRGTDSAMSATRLEQMTLRIDLLAGKRPATITLHGWLSAAEVAELERTVAEAGLPLRVDLAQLAGADAEGRRSLCRQKRRGVCLTGASPYIGLLLERSAAGAEDEREKRWAEAGNESRGQNMRSQVKKLLRTGGPATVVLVAAGLALAQCGGAPPERPALDSPVLDRTVLPIPEPKRPVYTELDVRNVKAPPPFEVKAPAGAPNVVIVLIDDLGLRRDEHLRRPDRDADARPPRPGRPALQQLPHHRALLADARRAQVRPQPPHREHGLHHRDGDGLPGRHRPDPERDGAGRRDAAPERLQHGGLRQVARDRRLGDERLRSVRPLADAPGLRQVLRLHRRRDQPVGALPLRRRHPGRAAGRPELPLHDRHDRQGGRPGSSTRRR